MLKINIDKTSEKVTKDPKHVEAAWKGRGKYMNKLKESILNDAKKGSGDTNNASNETTSATNTTTTPATSTNNTTTTTRSNDIYIHGVGMLPVLAIGVCIFFAYNNSQAKNKKLINEKQDQPPKRCHMLWKNIHNK